MFGPECTQQLLDFSSDLKLDRFCATLLLSKIVGLFMTIAGLFYKVPIIRNIWSKRTGAGLSIFSLYLEAVSYIARVVYNGLKSHALTTYGDYVFSTCQQFVIIFLVWRFATGGEENFSFFHISTALSIAVLLVAVMVSLPPERHFLIALCSLIISIFSKLPQIMVNFKYKKIGVQSTTTLWNGVITAAAKVFVCLVETTDVLMVASGVISFVLNSVLLAQVISYRNRNGHAELLISTKKEFASSAKIAAAAGSVSRKETVTSPVTKAKKATIIKTKRIKSCAQ